MKIKNEKLVIEGQDGVIEVAIERFATERYVHAWTVPVDYRANGVFTSYSSSKAPAEIPACESASAGYLGFIAVPASELAQLASAKKIKLNIINSECDKQVKAISESYPEAEVLSWPQQVKEAEALLNSAQANTPLLTALATARGIGVPDLAILVVAKANAFALATGEIIGKRQHLEQLVKAAESIADLEAIAW